MRVSFVSLMGVKANLLFVFFWFKVGRDDFGWWCIWWSVKLAIGAVWVAVAKRLAWRHFVCERRPDIGLETIKVQFHNKAYKAKLTKESVYT
jgi:hypothetical protein